MTKISCIVWVLLIFSSASAFDGSVTSPLQQKFRKLTSHRICEPMCNSTDFNNCEYVFSLCYSGNTPSFQCECIKQVAECLERVNCWDKQVEKNLARACGGLECTCKQCPWTCSSSSSALFPWISFSFMILSQLI